ncbi:MAG: alkaline phosphatase family protein [Desulfobacula sp.]|nr:alkaline phosphatase family protein [Desulfobacula sp.]
MNNTLLVIIDGLRSDALEKAHTPTLDYLMNIGSYSYHVNTVKPTMTLPSHFSVFTSLEPYSHGVLTNNALPNMAVAAQSLFYHVKNQSGTVAAFYSWEHLRNLAMPGTMDYSFFRRINSEKDLIILANNALFHIVNENPSFSFLYFEWTDIIGHEYGWMSSEYLKALEITDYALGIIVDSNL